MKDRKKKLESAEIHILIKSDNDSTLPVHFNPYSMFNPAFITNPSPEI